MMEIKKVQESDKHYWFSLDKHLAVSEFYNIAALKRGYVALKDGRPVGICRWNLFWDNIPFLTLLYLEEGQRRQGIGQEVMRFWESEMKKAGYKALMTSTQVDEMAQHFYRKLGYQDCGCLVLNLPQISQPMEMFMIKGI